MITKRKMFFKMLSIFLLVSMFASIDCQSNHSICDFLLKDGRVRDIGLYQFVWKSGEKISYRLFSREVDHKFGTEIPFEYELKIKKGNVSAQPPPFPEAYGLLKFYGGCTPVDKDGCYEYSKHYNCRLQQRVCLLR